MTVEQRHRFEILDCRVPLWPSGAFLFTFECGTAAVAFDVYFEDRCVVNQTIDSGQCHGGIWKNLAPGAKGLICSDQR